MELKKLTEKVIGCARAVHRALGPGFLEGIPNFLSSLFKCP